MNKLNLKFFALYSFLLINLGECQQTVTLLGNVQITYKNQGKYTDFLVTSPLGNGVSVSNCWLGIGLNLQPKMVK